MKLSNDSILSIVAVVNLLGRFCSRSCLVYVRLVVHGIRSKCHLRRCPTVHEGFDMVDFQTTCNLLTSHWENNTSIEA